MLKTAIVALIAGFMLSLAGPATALTATETKAYDAEIKKYTNIERTKRELRTLKHHSCLDRYAQAHANRLAKQTTDRLYHQDLKVVLKKCNMRTVGENAAFGFKTGREAVVGWMNSKGHRANLLNSKYRLLGIGVATNAKGRVYSVQVFGA